MKYLAIIIGLIIVLPVFGQRKKNDEQVEVVPTYVEGITYSLPRTGLRVYVRATKEMFEPGPYAGYAEQLLGLKNIKTRSVSKWTISEIRIESFSEPDPEQVYKAMGDASSMLNLTSDGRISGINIANVTPLATVLKTNKVVQIPDEFEDFSFDYFTDTPFYIQGDSTNGFQPVRVGAEQKAAEAAQRILDTRLNCYDMAAGRLDEFHPDGEAYKASLDELKKIEKNYLSLFVGRTTQKKDIFSFSYIPVKASGKGEVIFRISEENGVVSASDLSGKPVMVEFEVDKNLINKYTELSKSENPLAGKSGLYYRMPGMATVNIINELNIIASARLPIAQFGIVAPLPEDVVYGGFMVQYHIETGAIKSIYKR
ncbi:MAG: DUF4831 family protein [Bacteroidetes bacterium]|nr:DUF4831 family protein [Bacteroidota bacterium]